MLRFVLLLSFATLAWAQAAPAVRPNGMVELRIRNPLSPPEWALLQRALLTANENGVDLFARRYLMPNGVLRHEPHWGGNDGPDDVMENFWNWPLLYMLGGRGEVLDLYRKAWNAHIEQYTAEGMYHREYVKAFDWEHNSEGYAAFLNEGLADPADPRFQRRAVRFAGFYTGEDPEAPNYDPRHRIIRSVLNGSRGPVIETGPEYWYDKSASKDSRDFFSTWTNVRGDVPINLYCTSLVTNAYLLTGEEKYRRWIGDYAGAWVERAGANGGNFPGNVGLNGRTGEHWDGKWWGGIMAWDWGFGGFEKVARGVRTGMLNAHLATGDPRYLNALRRQLVNLLDHAVEDGSGNRLPPDRYNEKGWHSPRWGIHFARALVEVYLNSLLAEDWKRIEQTRALPVTAWDQALVKDYGNEYAWLAYLRGENAAYPADILRRTLEAVRRNSLRVASDATPDEKLRSDHAHSFLPVVLEGLFHTMLGAPTPHWGSGLLHAEVRYFDPARRRAGIPLDVASLVEKIEPARVVLTLLNTNQAEAREVILQAGAYGQHTIAAVRFPDTAPRARERGGRTIEAVAVSPGEPARPLAVNAHYFKVLLEPGCGARLELNLRRNSRRPGLAFPWHAGLAEPLG